MIPIVKNEKKNCLEICFLQIIIIDFVCSESQPIATNVFVKVSDTINRSNPIVQVSVPKFSYKKNSLFDISMFN